MENQWDHGGLWSGVEEEPVVLGRRGIKEWSLPEKQGAETFSSKIQLKHRAAFVRADIGNKRSIMEELGWSLQHQTH